MDLTSADFGLRIADLIGAAAVDPIVRRQRPLRFAAKILPEPSFRPDQTGIPAAAQSAFRNPNSAMA